MGRPKSEKPAHKAVISHPAHPAHELRLMVAGGKFKCDGCMQWGARQSYRCEPCDYDIHTCCVPPEKPLKHRKFNGCEFSFLLKPPGPMRVCDACGGQVLGFVYYNRQRDIDLHPACAVYPDETDIEGDMFDLHTEADEALICGRCKEKGSRRNSYWSYRSRGRDDNGEQLYLHVGCIIDGSGSDGSGSSQGMSAPTELLNAPGKKTWYKKVWKVTKIVAKLTYYLLTFDALGVFSIAGAIADVF